MVQNLTILGSKWSSVPSI